MGRFYKTIKEYIPIVGLFRMVKDQNQVAFLDSSLAGERGNFSILGIRPFHSIMKKDGRLWVNGEISLCLAGQCLRMS